MSENLDVAKLKAMINEWIEDANARVKWEIKEKNLNGADFAYGVKMGLELIQEAIAVGEYSPAPPFDRTELKKKVLEDSVLQRVKLMTESQEIPISFYGVLYRYLYERDTVSAVQNLDDVIQHAEPCHHRRG